MWRNTFWRYAFWRFVREQDRGRMRCLKCKRDVWVGALSFHVGFCPATHPARAKQVNGVKPLDKPVPVVKFKKGPKTKGKKNV